MSLPASWLAGLGTLSLRAKLYAVFVTMLGLILAVGAVSLTRDYQMLAALESYLDTERRIAELSLRSSQAMLKARRYEKDFLLKVRQFGFLEAKSRYATLLQNELATLREHMAAIRGLRAAPELAQRTLEIEAAAARYEAGFMRLVALHDTLIRRDSGLERRLDAEAAAIAAIVTGQAGAQGLETNLLRLRGEEKEFLLRGRDRQVAAFGAGVARLLADIEASGLPRPAKQRLKGHTESYLALFRRYVETSHQADREIATYLAAVHDIEPRLERLYASSTESAGATLDTVRGLAQVSLAMTIGASLGALALGLLLASIISRNIGRPVDALLDSAERIVQGDLDLRLPSGGGREMQLLRAMAEALQAAHRELQEKVTELAGANQALHERNQALQEAHQQLVQSEKMASIGQLAAGVAHEINNPVGFVHSNLGTLKGYLDGLLLVIAAYDGQSDQLPDAAQAALARVKAEADLDFLRNDLPHLLEESQEGLTRVRQIVHDLKTFSHVDGGQQWQLADLHRGLDSTLNIVRNEIKYKAEVVREYGELPPIECLPSQLNQVFMNLLVNAGHAIEGQGTITIRTGTAGEEVWVDIADTGCGIAEEHRARIFDPFFTTKPVGQGTGLGLSLSYGIVRKHHGRIEVDSAPGRGSRFRVCLPCRQPRAEVPGPALTAT